jgi:hypothetical protein
MREDIKVWSSMKKKQQNKKNGADSGRKIPIWDDINLLRVDSFTEFLDWTDDRKWQESFFPLLPHKEKKVSFPVLPRRLRKSSRQEVFKNLLHEVTQSPSGGKKCRKSHEARSSLSSWSSRERR